MKFKALNNEPLQFYNAAGELMGTIQISGSGDMILRPESGSSQDVIIGNPNQVGDVEMGAVGTPITLKLLGGGTVSGNGNTLNIGTASDVVNLYNVVYSQSFAVTGSISVSGSIAGTPGIVNTLTASYALTASHALNGGGGGGGGTPGGSDTQVQFNDGGSFGGDAGFTFNKTTNSITAITNITASGNISSSANVIAKTGSFSHIQGNSPITVGDQINFQQPLTASIVSASSYVGSITNAISASHALTASFLIGGGGSVPSGTVSGSTQITAFGFISSSATASLVSNSETSSFVVNSQTSSFITNTETGSFLTNASTASFNNLIISHPSGNLVPGNGSTSSIAITVVNDGADRFALDGVKTGSVTLVAGNAYKFDTSDGTNNGHPFAFKISGSETTYTTGVTVNGSSYTSPDPGDAGAYVLISVTNTTPALRYYCTSHGNGMGGEGVLSIQTGSVIQNGFLDITGSLDILSGSISLDGDVTASGNISSSGTIVGSNLSGTNTGDQDLSSYAQTANVVANSATASFVTNSQTSSMSVLTSSFAVTASHALNTTTIPTGTVSGSSQITELGFVTSSATASFVNNSATSSFVVNSATASFITNSQTSSMSVLSASFATTASHALNTTTIPTGTVSGSTQISELGFVTSSATSSFVVNSATASFVTNSQTGSFLTNNDTGSLGSTTITGSLTVSGSNTLTNIGSFNQTGDTTFTGSLTISGSSSPLLSLPDAPNTAIVISGSNDGTRLHIYDTEDNTSPVYTEGAGIVLTGGEGAAQAILEMSAVGSTNGGSNNEQTFIRSSEMLTITGNSAAAGDNIKLLGSNGYGLRLDASTSGVSLQYFTNGGSTVSTLELANGTYTKADASGTYYKVGRSSTDWFILSSTLATFRGVVSASSAAFTGHVTASGNISASGTIIASNLSGTNTGDQDLAAYALTANVVANNATASFVNNSQTASFAITGSSVLFANVTASSNISSSGNVIASNVFLPSNGKISFDNSLDGSDQFISGVDNQIVVDGDDLIVFKADSGGYEFRDTSNAATVHITTAGAITASGIISASNLTGTNTGDQDLSSYAQTANVVANSATASFIVNSQTSSMSVLSASFAVTASHALNAGSSVPAGTVSGSGQITQLGFVTSSATSSFVLNSSTASFAITGSNVLFGNITASGTVSSSGQGIFSGVLVTDANYDAAGTAKYRVDGYSVLQNSGTTLKIAGNNYWETITYGNEDTDRHSFVGQVTASGLISGSGFVGDISQTKEINNSIKIFTWFNAMS